MPAMCRLSTMPTTRSTSASACDSPRRTGVIAITADHHQVADRHRGDAEPGGRPAGHHPQRGAHPRPRRAGRPPGAAGSPAATPAAPVSSGSGRSSTSSTPAASRNATALNANGPASGGSPSPATAASAERGEVRRRHRADGGGPDDERELPATAGRLGQVDRRVTGLQVGRGPAAEEQHAERRAAAPPGSPRRAPPRRRRPHRATYAATRPGPTAAGVHDPGDRDGEQRGADHAGSSGPARTGRCRRAGRPAARRRTTRW